MVHGWEKHIQIVGGSLLATWVRCQTNAQAIKKFDKWKNLATKNIDLNISSELNKDMGTLPHEEKFENITQGWWNGLMCKSAFLKETD